MEGKMIHRLSIISFILMLWLVIISNSFAQGSLDQRIVELTQQISKEMTDNNKKTIAVIEFSDLRGNVTDLGRYISEELITKLYLTKKFKVIERQLLNKIIAEQKLSLAGMIDPTSAKKLGKVLGVDAIVSGTQTDLAQGLKINARMLNTETGEIFAVASVEIFKDESVTKLMSEIGSSKEALTDSKLSGVTTNYPPNTKNDLSIKSVKAEGFIFTPQSCKIKEDNIDCTILIENTLEEQKQVYFGLKGNPWLTPCYIYDDRRDQYIPDIKIGKRIFQGGYSYETQQFVPNAPIAVHFLVKNFNSDSKYITATISANVLTKTVSIPEIPITKTK